ncbi:MAG TPA: hypothetical protein VE860_00455 [Chthoniobacterales bacterium]|jgi:hypothetical protein|nr:hypothetical protein [Chthoniobacterales bacterium]
MPGESEIHRRLKEQAFLWAYDRGFRCCALEVRAPHSSFIVDVAAIRFDRLENQPTVAIFECKQSRQDLDRDNGRRNELNATLLSLQERRKNLEHLLAVHYPSLRTSNSLFPEWSTFDFSSLDHKPYRRTIAKIKQIHRQLFGNTKFDLMSRYELSNLHYLVTTPSLLHEAEIPLGWGLLETDGNDEIIEKCVPVHVEQSGTHQWLERIAKAATRSNEKPIRGRSGRAGTLVPDGRGKNDVSCGRSRTCD